MKSVYIILFTLIVGLSLFAEEPATSENMQGHYIGAVGGLSLGYGLTYRYWPEDLGFQITFSPMIVTEDIGVIIGGAFLYPLHETRRTRLFLFAGGSYSLESYIEENWDDTEERWIEGDQVTSHNFAISAGPGIELYIMDHIALDAMFGYAYSTMMGGLTFTGETGIFYRY